MLAALGFAVLSCAATSAQTAAAPDADAEARYIAAIEKRTQDITVLLSFKDAAASNRIHSAIMAQYRALRDWHDTNGPVLKRLQKEVSSADAAQSAKAKKQIAAIQSSLKELHDQYLADLSADLSAVDVDKVKDKMTYNKVRITYDGYCEMLPALTDAQKAKILDWLKEAREAAMDCGSADEKHAVFNKYKGRINNYLSKEGYDLATASKEWNARINARKQEESKPAN